MIIILTTYPDKKTAKQAAEKLVDNGLAKCVNIIKIESSIYKWKGKISSEREYLLLIKAPTANYPKIENWVKNNHPYELPEVIKIPAEGGLAAYLDWIDDRV